MEIASIASNVLDAVAIALSYLPQSRLWEIQQRTSNIHRWLDDDNPATRHAVAPDVVEQARWLRAVIQTYLPPLETIDPLFAERQAAIRQVEPLLVF